MSSPQGLLDLPVAHSAPLSTTTPAREDSIWQSFFQVPTFTCASAFLSWLMLFSLFLPLLFPHSTTVSCCTPTQLRELVRTQPIPLSRASETPDQWSHMVLCLQTLPEHRFRCSSRKGLKGALVCAQDSEAFASVVHSPGRSRRPGQRALWTNPQNPWLAHVEKG